MCNSIKKRQYFGFFFNKIFLECTLSGISFSGSLVNKNLGKNSAHQKFSGRQIQIDARMVENRLKKKFSLHHYKSMIKGRRITKIIEFLSEASKIQNSKGNFTKRCSRSLRENQNLA